MRLWRISRYPALDGQGGLVADGRWHTKGRHVTYAALHSATALLEWIVHLEISASQIPAAIPFAVIEAPDDISLERAANLQANWRYDTIATQRLGNEWLESKRTALLLVPSVLAPETESVLINPQHRDARRIAPPSRLDYPFDRRFLKV